jgi:hypothetical protein
MIVEGGMMKVFQSPFWRRDAYGLGTPPSATALVKLRSGFLRDVVQPGSDPYFNSIIYQSWLFAGPRAALHPGHLRLPNAVPRSVGAVLRAHR